MLVDDTDEIDLMNHIKRLNQEFERTIPIIHREGRNSYSLIQKTKSGVVRIMARVSSEAVARNIVNDFIRKMRDESDDDGK